MERYLPEGVIISTKENVALTSTPDGLERAMKEAIIIEATAVMCDEDLNLYFRLGDGKIKGIMPRNECAFNPMGGEIKDIAVLTRVGKPVACKVLALEYRNGEAVAILSRRQAQLEFYRNRFPYIRSGDVINAVITHLESFGAFVDIGCGVCSLLSVDCISISRISHPKDRLKCGMQLDVIVKSVDADNFRIFVTLKELLGTWEENARAFNVGQTVTGIVRSVESYGAFIELAPNLAGLAELRDAWPYDPSALVGKSVSVYIKSIIPERMKIKLVIIDVCREGRREDDLKAYFRKVGSGHISRWRYSPICSARVVESVFDDVQ